MLPETLSFTGDASWRCYGKEAQQHVGGRLLRLPSGFSEKDALRRAALSLHPFSLERTCSVKRTPKRLLGRTGMPKHWRIESILAKTA